MLKITPHMLLPDIVKISGPYITPSKNTIYSSYHMKDFEIVDSQRNTLARLDMFGITDLHFSFANKTVLDIGSNLGAMSFMMAKFGATVTGIEFNADRVNICNRLARYWSLNARFIQHDFNQLESFAPSDVVLSLAVDYYVNDKDKFYQGLANIINEVCYYESNDPSLQVDEFKKKMLPLHTNFLGNSSHHTDNSQGKPRKLFVIGKQKFPYLGGIAKKTSNQYVKTYYSQDEIDAIANHYKSIKNVFGVPKMTFSGKDMITKDVGVNSLATIDLKDGPQYKKPFLRFLRELNNAGYSHRDLNVKNVIVGKDLTIIDWDFLSPQQVPLNESYDVTGHGLESPRNTRHTNIFKSFPNLGIPSIAEVLGITHSDIC